MSLQLETSVHWKELLRKDLTVISVRNEALTSVPKAISLDKLDGVTMEQAALRASYAQGYRDALEYIFEELAKRVETEEKSQFIDTSKD